MEFYIRFFEDLGKLYKCYFVEEIILYSHPNILCEKYWGKQHEMYTVLKKKRFYKKHDRIYNGNNWLTETEIERKITRQLACFFKISSYTHLSQDECNIRMNDYIKENNLINYYTITPDEKLSKLIHCNKAMGFGEFYNRLYKHFS